jgi:hypothetical protein
MPLSRQELELRLEEAARVLAMLRRCTLDMQEVRVQVFATRHAATSAAAAGERAAPTAAGTEAREGSARPTP